MDSGAMMTLLHMDFMQDLGIDEKSCTLGHTYLGDGSELEIMIGKMLIFINGIWMHIPVGFTEKIQFSVLGRDGVFNRMVLAFDHKAGSMYSSIRR